MASKTSSSAPAGDHRAAVLPTDFRPFPEKRYRKPSLVSRPPRKPGRAFLAKNTEPAMKC